jgi:hypothetical protein
MRGGEHDLMTIDRSVRMPAGDPIVLAFAGFGATVRRRRLLAS